MLAKQTNVELSVGLTCRQLVKWLTAVADTLWSSKVHYRVVNQRTPIQTPKPTSLRQYLLIFSRLHLSLP